MTNQISSSTAEARLLAQVYEYLLNRARQRKLHIRQVQMAILTENVTTAAPTSESFFPLAPTDQEEIAS